MTTRSNCQITTLIVCLVLPTLSPFMLQGAPDSSIGDDEERVAQTSQAVPGDDAVSPSTYLALSRLAYRYGKGLDEISAGDVAAGTATLRTVFTDDAEIELVWPPAYSSLNGTVVGGGAGLAQAAEALFGAFNIIRTQHMMTNFMVEMNGPNKATMNSYVIAVHSHPDESVWQVTVRDLDDIRKVNGQWRIKHRVITITSAADLPASALGRTP